MSEQDTKDGEVVIMAELLHMMLQNLAGDGVHFVLLWTEPGYKVRTVANCRPDVAKGMMDESQDELPNARVITSGGDMGNIQ